MKMRLIVTGMAALAVSLGAVLARGAETEVQVSLDKVPAKVRATIKKHAEGAKIQKVEIVSTKVYDVELRKNGKTTEFSVSAEGKYLGVKADEDKAEAKSEKKGKAAKKAEAKDDDDEKDEDKAEAKSEKKGGKAAKKAESKDDDDEKEEGKAEAKSEKKGGEAAKKAEAKEEDEKGESTGIPLAKAPKAVQATVRKLLGKGKLVKLAKEGDGNYELDYQVEGVTQAAIVAPDGKIQEQEITVDPSTLPKAVTDTVKRLFPKGKIKVAERSTSKDGVVYEIQVAVDKKSQTVTVSPNGEVK
jgi:hypothetical protein